MTGNSSLRVVTLNAVPDGVQSRAFWDRYGRRGRASTPWWLPAIVTALAIFATVGCGSRTDVVLASRVAAAETAIEIVQDFLDEIIKRFGEREPEAPQADADQAVEFDANELTTKLQRLEEQLNVLDEELAKKVAKLRKQLATKMNEHDVRKLVTAELEPLSKRLDDVEARDLALQQRADEGDKRDVALEKRLDKLEKLLGLATEEDANPRPLQVETGQPIIHPLTKRWGELLCRSESNRRELARLRKQGYGDLADPVKKALAAKEQIVVETADLQTQVREEFRKQRAAKVRLIRTGIGPRTPEVREIDR